ncbi:MAG: hypothetical protein RTU30_04055 [Candidatus Thorarchaeota archaeon]
MSKNQFMSKPIDLHQLVNKLLHYGYPEFAEWGVNIQWGGTSAYAEISWESRSKSMTINVNQDVRSWPESAVNGLLSHELSHPIIGDVDNTESITDADVIARGLGTYLALERLVAGKYQDHILRHGRDRYLGYTTLRGMLTKDELSNLDKLMSDVRISPLQSTKLNHDIAIHRSTNTAIIHTGGYTVRVNRTNPNQGIRIFIRDDHTLIYLDDELVADLIV